MAEAGTLGNVLLVDQQLATGVLRLLAAKYFMLASFVVLVYDHLITFSDEVDRIWRREWSGATWLFALNRYLTELQFIVNLHFMIQIGLARQVLNESRGLWLFTAIAFARRSCDRFIPFAGVSTMISVGIAESKQPTVKSRALHFETDGRTVVLILRTYALYQRSSYVLALLLVIWCGQMTVMGTTMHRPTRVPLPEGLVGCIQGASGKYTAAFWLALLVMDTVIFVLTVWKTMQYIRQNQNRVPLLHVILRDGVLYFVVILVANLSNCFIVYLAEPDLKVIGASFAQIITIMMISRLQLNLRSDSIYPPEIPTLQLPSHSSVPKFREKQFDSHGTSSTLSSLSYFFETTVKELGGDVFVPVDERREEIPENPELSERRGDSKPEFQSRVDEAGEDIEMKPIRPVSGGLLEQDRSLFSPEESSWLESLIRVSSAVAGDQSVDRISAERP
ncbi:hypothetical protein BDV93DRAFT_560356 [Ceratobasidium sp. AG-I]|nr:hypothetical protein BDV93DRAFT_560356 [Ceratobasidium sp. AG-I]